MKVFKKLQEARVKLLQSELKKSGKNKFAGFEYFELGDFIPSVTNIFNEVGLCGVIHFLPETAILTVYDVEDGSCIDFRSPLVYAENQKGQAIQSLGSTHTYMRRYLWLLAMDITEHDSVDAAPQESFKQSKATKPEPVKEPEAVKERAKDVGNDFTVPANRALFVEKTIEIANTCESKNELMSIWKEHQKDIDVLKNVDTGAYATLHTAFATVKQNLSEE